MRFSIATISALTSVYWRARMPRLNRAAEELQQLRSANALSDYYRARSVHAVNLKNQLRDIETNRANLAHGRLPSTWFVSTQPPYGTLMPQSGRRPQHHSRPGRANGKSRHVRSALKAQ